MQESYNKLWKLFIDNHIKSKNLPNILSNEYQGN